MIAVTLLLVGLLGDWAAANNNVNTSWGTCEIPRQQLITNFLHAEKSRAFAQAISTASSWLSPGQLRNFRFLPTFFEENSNGAFSQFFLLDGNFTANEAVEACLKFDGAFLASLHNTKRIEFINKILVHGNYWFGLNRWAGCPAWTWSNGFKLGDSNLFWGDNEPFGANLGYDCVRTVNPPSLNCNATGCFANEWPTWKSENCETAKGFSALCETRYPRRLYSLIRGSFDWKTAQGECKKSFGQFGGAALASPKTWYDFNHLFYGVNMYFKKWNCWVGVERYNENSIWKHKYTDGTYATRFSHLPRLYGTNYTMWTDSQTCVSLYDGAYSSSLGFAEQGYFNYNSCDFKHECAICEWYWPL